MSSPPQVVSDTKENVIAPTPVQPLPYRWGKFQGWFEIVVGGVFCIVAVCVILVSIHPDNRVARGFVKGFFDGSGRPELFQRAQSGAVEDYSYLTGYFAVTILSAFGAGIGLLKKRLFGMICVVILIFRAIGDVSILGLAFWLGSIPYYYKRRREFRRP